MHKVKAYDRKLYSGKHAVCFYFFFRDEDEMRPTTLEIASSRAQHLPKEESQGRAALDRSSEATRTAGRVCFKLQIAVADDRGRENRICVWSRVGR